VATRGVIAATVVAAITLRLPGAFVISPADMQKPFRYVNRIFDSCVEFFLTGL
jgi:hypothetical protein